MSCDKEIADEFVKASRSLCESYSDFEKLDEKSQVLCQVFVALSLCNRFFEVLSEVVNKK